MEVLLKPKHQSIQLVQREWRIILHINTKKHLLDFYPFHIFIEVQYKELQADMVSY